MDGANSVSSANRVLVVCPGTVRLHCARGCAAQGLGLKSRDGWRTWCKTGSRPANIPFNPEVTYKGAGWQGYVCRPHYVEQHPPETLQRQHRTAAPPPEPAHGRPGAPPKQA